ncbi:hypothetical protein BGLA2_380002 [Burkholderia gladioli]|nr:hypothetical protein BGLA2_380002 [Burkholderia gladioli]
MAPLPRLAGRMRLAALVAGPQAGSSAPDEIEPVVGGAPGVRMAAFFSGDAHVLVPLRSAGVPRGCGTHRTLRRPA